MKIKRQVMLKYFDSNLKTEAPRCFVTYVKYCCYQFIVFPNKVKMLIVILLCLSHNNLRLLQAVALINQLRVIKIIEDTRIDQREFMSVLTLYVCSWIINKQHIIINNYKYGLSFHSHRFGVGLQ